MIFSHHKLNESNIRWDGLVLFFDPYLNAWLQAHIEVLSCTRQCRGGRRTWAADVPTHRFRGIFPTTTCCWLAGGDWNMDFFSTNWECHHPNWLPYFFRGVETTNRLMLQQTCCWCSNNLLVDVFVFMFGDLKLCYQKKLKYIVIYGCSGNVPWSDQVSPALPSSHCFWVPSGNLLHSHWTWP